MTIAGFDPGSGAGITADLLVFARHGIFATSAITALTVQSTRGVRRVEAVDPVLLQDTLDELENDLPADGIKVGMLCGAAQVHVVAEHLATIRTRRKITVVVDPVIASSSGAVLLDGPGLTRLCEELLPLADVVTPNLQEAALLTGMPCRTMQQAEHCASALAMRYPGILPVVTGGHLPTPSDLLWFPEKPIWLPGQHIATRATHGTGCVFSSALLASRMKGCDWLASATSAKEFVTTAIRDADCLGTGHGPTRLVTRYGTANSDQR